MSRPRRCKSRLRHILPCAVALPAVRSVALGSLIVGSVALAGCGPKSDDSTPSAAGVQPVSSNTAPVATSPLGSEPTASVDPSDTAALPGPIPLPSASQVTPTVPAASDAPTTSAPAPTDDPAPHPGSSDAPGQSTTSSAPASSIDPPAEDPTAAPTHSDPGPSAPPQPTTTTAETPPPADVPWQAAITTQIEAATLTQGYRAWVEAYVQDCAGTDTAVVIKDGGQVVSEGIAYGMLLAVGQGDQTLFDKLWRFYLAHVDENGLMNWSMDVCAAPGDNDANAASDGDLDAAMALVQAASAWGGDYLQAAETLAQNILAHETATCAGRLVLEPGDSWGGCDDPSGETRINPSYFAPGYYRVFAQRFPTQAAEWTALLDASYDLYASYQARMDGLFPDWSDADGADWYGSSYGYDACRTPWRVAVDYAWSGDPRALSTLQAVSARVASAGGIPLADFPNNSAFQGAFALADVTDPAAFDTAVSRWLGAGGDDQPYFQGTLRLLYLQVALGQFPSTLSAAPPQ